MSKWTNKILGKLVEITSSKRIFYEDYISSGVPFYRSKEVIELANNKRNVSTELFISKKKFNDIKDKFGAPVSGDMLLTSVGTLGVPYIVKDGEEFYFKDGNLTWFKNFTDGLLNTYLLYWIVSPIGRETLNSISIGSTQPALTIIGLKNIELTLPPLPEQKAIADVLSSLDDKIDLLHRQNKTLEAMAEALFRQWFVEEANDEWEDNTPSCLIEKILGGDWGKEYILPDLIQVCCIRGTDIADIQNGIPSRTPIRFIKKSRLLNNDIMVGDLIVEISGGTETQSTGRAMFIHDLTTDLFPFPIYFSNFCRLIRPAKKEYTLFLFHFFRHLYNSNELFSYENGTSGIKNLNYKALLYEEKAKIPPDKLIRKFDSQCMPFWDKILKNKIQICTIEKLRNALLPKLMSGEVRVGG